MNKRDFINLLETLPEDVEITVQTCSYDGTSEVYEDQEPRIITTHLEHLGITYAILTGAKDFYGQTAAVKEFTWPLNPPDIVGLLGPHSHIVEVK